MSTLAAATSITIEHDWTDVVAAIGTGLGAVAATAALIYAGRQLQLGRRSAEQQRQGGREELAYRYFERMMHPDMIPFTEKWVALCKLGKDDPDGAWERWQSSPLRDRLETLVVPNLVEELAGMYHRRLVDETVTKDFLGGLVVAWWERGEWFVNKSRADRGSDELFIQWEQLYVRINTAAESRS